MGEEAHVPLISTLGNMMSEVKRAFFAQIIAPTQLKSHQRGTLVLSFKALGL